MGGSLWHCNSMTVINPEKLIHQLDPGCKTWRDAGGGK
ncbi:hypothetical protein FORC44_2970 [Escherichia coli]|nr:hypothetical protein FORC44_2970 [Escherichia coli]